MGGNCSYDSKAGLVPMDKRTHNDTEYRIDQHKVLLSRENEKLSKNILNSNSLDATYLIAKRCADDTIQIHSINIFDGHHLSYEINIIFDSNGNIVPFNNGKGTHAHSWEKDMNTGKLGRKSHSKNC